MVTSRRRGRARAGRAWSGRFPAVRRHVGAPATAKWYGGVVRKDHASALVRVKDVNGKTSMLRVPTTSLVARAAKERRVKRPG
jgi:hypothetical protein